MVWYDELGLLTVNCHPECNDLLNITSSIYSAVFAVHEYDLQA